MISKLYPKLEIPTKFNLDIDDWRLIMGDKFNTLQVLAITELVFAFIIFVFGHRVEIFWSLSTSPDRTVMARTGGVNGNFVNFYLTDNDCK